MAESDRGAEGQTPDDSTRTVSGQLAAVPRQLLRLLVFDGDVSRRIELQPEGALVIGRANDADVVLGDTAASRRHARILTSRGHATLTDLGSHNGTLVNGERVVGSRELAPGDTVTIGECALVLQAGRTTRARAFLSPDELSARLDDEIERAVERDAVAIVLLQLPPASRVSLPALLERFLSRGERACLLPDGAWCLILPGTAPATAADRVRAALRAWGFSPARAGVAAAPDDAADAQGLLTAARAALAGAPAGDVAVAAGTETTLRIADRLLVVADPAMSQVFGLVRRLARASLPVLVEGETGTGKENVGFALHAWSARATGPFVTINCAAIPDTLIESELFGHERGAFSGAVAAKQGLFEAAHGGTLFLDEVGELSAAAQAKLLRTLETLQVMRVGATQPRTVDVRVVAATHRDLEAEVAAGTWRRDLYFRMGAARVLIPPLRERPREVALLARFFVERACVAAGRQPMQLAPATLAVLGQAAWTGNVRELRNAMDYAVATAAFDLIEPSDLPSSVRPEVAEIPPQPPVPPRPAPAAPAPGDFRPITDEIRELEERRIREALVATRFNQTRAAALIGMPLRTFISKMKQFGIVRRVE